MKNYINLNGKRAPIIKGAFGGGGGGQSGGYNEEPNSLFSTDILFMTSALGEGPVYRINPNGPQDIEINDSSIDDLIKINGNGTENEERFKTLKKTGTLTQSALPTFGEATRTPQQFASPVSLKKGNIAGVPASGISFQPTSAFGWDKLQFNFVVNSLFKQEDNGDVKGHNVKVRVIVYNSTGTTEIARKDRKVDGKTNVPFKFNLTITIPSGSRDDAGYQFSVSKLTNESQDSRINSNIQIIGWTEIEDAPQTYPRTAVIGYAIKALNEHVGSIPTFTSLVKGLLVKVPSNYNQPILSTGEIDWRQVEVAGDSGGDSYQTNGYFLQKPGSGSVQTASNPQIYIGTWDGTFVYSWTQNPVWIMYDILTNDTYGLGIPEQHIDKYKFYQIAQYCDAVDEITGQFQGVDGLADGSFRHKPRGKFTSVKETLIGLANNVTIKERRFVLDMLISDQAQTMDVLNQIAASFRGTLVYSFGKLSLAVDRPDQYPVMVFNETNIKTNTFKISGSRESDMITGVDVSYIEPTNHYKREVVRIDTDDANTGADKSVIENIASLDLPGVTRRSQALRFAQYQIAATKYLRRIVSFDTSLDALSLAPGDLISVSQNMTGVNYGFGGKVANNSVTTSGNANIYLEHFTFPAISSSFFTDNTHALALRVISPSTERIDLYILSDSDYELISTDNVSVGSDLVRVKVTKRWNPITSSLNAVINFNSNNAPKAGDLWSLGEWAGAESGNIYGNKAGRLFTVAEIERETDEEVVSIIAKEYVSNVYTDSDTFIDYTPTAYIDIPSPLRPPPAPIFDFRSAPRRNLDGTIAFDGFIDQKTERLDYSDNYSTEFEIARPAGSTAVTNTSQSVLTVIVDNASAIADESEESVLLGKAGFSSPIGQIRLLCNAVSQVDNGDGTSNVRLTLEGLNVTFEENIFKHVLEVNDGSFQGLKGDDFVTIPLKEKTSENSLRNFPAFAPDTVAVSSQIQAFDKTQDTLEITNTLTGDVNLITLLPTVPFYVNINQLLDTNFMANNSFYLSGTSKEIILSNTIASGTVTEFIDLPVRPRDKIFTRFYVDGIRKSSGQFTLNDNESIGRLANIEYTVASGDTEYRVEIDHYTVPTIEVGDNVSVAVNNTYSVTETSYDPLSPSYNAALTSNSIFRIKINDTPNANLAGLFFTNVSQNPIGTINNVSSNTCTFDYDESVYPGNFRLGNNFIYDLNVTSDYEPLFLTQDNIIKNLPEGITTIRARNINQFGRRSPYVEKSVVVSPLPIQKVNPITVTESLYIEQNSGAAVRIHITFPHITGQEVTDYEISYKLDEVEFGGLTGTDDPGTDLTSFNTFIVSAAGVDDDGNIRAKIDGINRGPTAGQNLITVKVTPLNGTLRGVTATQQHSILGKLSPPQNVFNFTGGQQTDQITFFWEYPLINGLLEADLKEVVIRRIQGSQTIDEDTFIAAIPLTQVAAGVSRKSVPIDTFGEFTYLVKTRDTSGNFSDTVTGIVITTSKPTRNQIIAAYNEDSPSVNFTDITNTNSGQSNYPAFTDVNFGGLVRWAEDTTAPGVGNPSSLTGNANGSSTGLSAITGQTTDLLVDGTGEYITEIRDFGATVTAAVLVDIQGEQSVQTTFNDQHEHIVQGTTDASTAGQMKDASFGGLGHLLGFNNTTFTGDSAIRYDSNNQTLMSTTSSGNVYAIHLHGNFSGNATGITGITQANPAVITTTGSEHGIAVSEQVIVHDVLGMDEINNLQVYAKRISATTVELYTDQGLTSGLDSTGFTAYTSGGVIDEGDYANSNVFAFIAGTIDNDTIKLGNTFFANGDPTGGNTYANLSVAGTNYFLVDLKQFNDFSSTETFQGDLGAVTTQTFIRTTSVANSTLYGADGNVDQTQFDAYDSTTLGFVPYEAGTRPLRQFQLKFIVNNTKPDEFDFTIDKFRYTLDRELTIFNETVTYDGTPKTVDISSANFNRRPVFSITPLATATAQTALVSAASATSVSFSLYDIENSASSPTTEGIEVTVTATGV